MLKKLGQLLILVTLLCGYMGAAQAIVVYKAVGTYVSGKSPLGDIFSLDAGTYSMTFDYTAYATAPSEPPVLGLSLYSQFLAPQNSVGDLIGVGSFMFTVADAGIHEFSIYSIPGEMFSYADFTVEIAAVPIPAAFLLFGPSIIALFGIARRNRAKV